VVTAVLITKKHSQFNKFKPMKISGMLLLAIN